MLKYTRSAVLSLSTSLMLITGCSSSSKPELSPQIEKVSYEEVVRQEVAAHPTKFSSQEPARILWNRSKLLSDSYFSGGNAPSLIVKPSVNGFRVRYMPTSVKIAGSDQSTTLGYDIHVRRLEGVTDLMVSVDAYDHVKKTRTNNSYLLAKNIARFLHTGTLERSLLNP